MTRPLQEGEAVSDTSDVVGARRHPYYGPCDSFGPDDECAECERLRFHEQAEEQWRQWLQSEPHARPPQEGEA